MRDLRERSSVPSPANKPRRDRQRVRATDRSFHKGRERQVERSLCAVGILKPLGELGRSQLGFKSGENWAFPGGASGKEPACWCRNCKRLRFDPWVGKTPWRRAWQPTPVFLPGESLGRRSLWATAYRVAQSRTRLSGCLSSRNPHGSTISCWRHLLSLCSEEKGVALIRSCAVFSACLLRVDFGVVLCPFLSAQVGRVVC